MREVLADAIKAQRAGNRNPTKFQESHQRLIHNLIARQNEDFLPSDSEWLARTTLNVMSKNNTYIPSAAERFVVNHAGTQIIEDFLAGHNDWQRLIDPRDDEELIFYVPFFKLLETRKQAIEEEHAVLAAILDLVAPQLARTIETGATEEPDFLKGYKGPLS